MRFMLYASRLMVSPASFAAAFDFYVDISGFAFTLRAIVADDRCQRLSRHARYMMPLYATSFTTPPPRYALLPIYLSRQIDAA